MKSLLHIGCRMWFMQDAAPPISNREARYYQDEQLPGKWIGRVGPIAWPPSKQLDSLCDCVRIALRAVASTL